ncbi:MAG: BrnT family toxin [Fibromonadaceae bacterium]|jgi:uncharacterized DUF497 family protein|nr:BrnT family toxin [Fibromonadaceae bacterium]
MDTTAKDNELVFEWDDSKDDLNRQKHGFSFDEAIAVFLDLFRIEYYDKKHSTQVEDRYITLGTIRNVVVLCVSYTDRNGHIRLISARKATPKEEKMYYACYKNAFKS